MPPVVSGKKWFSVGDVFFDLLPLTAGYATFQVLCKLF